MSGHVFVSYSHLSDKPYVDSLAAYLAAAGVPVWYDTEVKPGDEFSVRIQTAIDDCAVFVPVLTPASVTSEWVRRELSRAVRLRKPVWPLLREECDPPVEVEGLHHEDVTDGRMPGTSFITGLRNLTGSTRPAVPAVSRAGSAASRRLSRRGLLVATGVAALAGGGAIGLWRESSAGLVSAPPDGKPLGGGGSASDTHRATAGTQVRTLTNADRVLAVAYSPPRLGLIASAGVDRTIRLWRSDTGAPVGNLTGHDSWVGSIAYSPSGAQLATASGDHTVRICDAGTGNLIHKLDHPDEVFSVAYAPNSAQLATACMDGTVRVWDAGTGTVLESLPGHKTGVCAVAYSPNSAELATASRDGQVFVWRADTLAFLRALPGHNGPVALAYSPNSVQLATVGNDQTVRLWQAGTGTVIRSFTGHDDSIYSVSYAPDSTQFATASQDRTAKVWRADSGEGIRTLPHSSAVHCVAYSPDGSQLAIAVDDNTVRIWAT